MYTIEKYHRQKARELGVEIYPSKKGNYKLDVYRNNEYITSIGDIRYKDFILYWKEKGKAYAEERRRLYHIRHKNEGIRGKLAKEILW
jgi:hypothetical protein